MADAENPEWPIPEALRLRILRQIDELGTTQAAVASKASITGGTMSYICSGRIKASAALPDICQRLRIDIFEYLPLDEQQRRMLRTLGIARSGPAGAVLRFVEACEESASGIAAKAELERMKSEGLGVESRPT